MRYPFITKASFLALCVAVFTPCYLLAFDRDNEEKKPPCPVAFPSQSTSADLKHDGEEDEGNLEAVAASAASTTFERPLRDAWSTASGFPKEFCSAFAKAFQNLNLGAGESDKDTRGSERQAREQERAPRFVAKEQELLDALAGLKEQETSAIMAVVEALETKPDEVPTYQATINLIDQEIRRVEDELADVRRSQASSAQTNPQEKEWAEFGERWSQEKAKRRDAGYSDFSPDQKIAKELERFKLQLKFSKENSSAKEKK